MERTTMPIRLTSFLILSLALITSACGSSMKKTDIKQNPHPKMRYEITMKIEGAPGPFDAVTGYVQYKVENDRCVPLQPISGATLAPEKSVPLVLRRVTDQLYTSTFYVDLLQDEDYYGLGVCHWAVVAAQVDLQRGSIDFSPDLFKDDIFSQKSISRYFSNHSYHDPQSQGVDSGNAHKLDFGSEANETFSVTLSAKEDFR